MKWGYIMTETDFKRMKRALDQKGFFRIHEVNEDTEEYQSMTDVYFSGGEYSIYSVWLPKKHGRCEERNCIAVDWNIDRLKYLFVD